VHLEESRYVIQEPFAITFIFVCQEHALTLLIFYPTDTAQLILISKHLTSELSE